MEKSHQELGNQLKLFFFDESSPGSCIFLPHGTKLYNNLVNYIKKEYEKRGYSEVMTPILFDKSIWKTSGHWQQYKENMFIIDSKDDDKDNDKENSEESTRQYALKPMNCCSHCLIFKHMNPSYKDLPLRLADFGVLHRNECSGSLKGLTRVRKFCQDDAHIYCSFEQIKEEIKNVLDFIKKVYTDFNMEIKFGLSTRPDEYIGDLDTWNKAEEILKEILSEINPNYEINEKDGAFYGNKIDCKVKDAFGREHQLATIQLDFNLPERFNLTYKDNDGKEIRPVMIHRAIFGSVERFIGILLESTQGNIPFFVNPRQIAIIPVKNTNEINSYCVDLQNKLKKLNYNTSYYNDNNTMQKKIAVCETLHYNYIILIGNKEVENNILHIKKNKQNIKFDDFVLELEKKMNF